MRLFIGIEFPPKIIDGLCSLQDELRGLIKSGRFPVRENLHLTLQFLGETPENRIAEINCKLEAVALQHSTFQLSLGDRLGCFGQANPVRVVWLGIEGEVDALLCLQASVATAMQGLGFNNEDRAYRPHITLVRDAIFLRCPGRPKNDWNTFPVGQFPAIPVERFSLISSSLEQGKHHYRELKTFDLRKDVACIDTPYAGFNDI